MKVSSIPLLFLFLFVLSANALSQSSTGVRISVKAFLQGALMDVEDGQHLMRDDLRRKKLIPLTEPYTGMRRYLHQSGGGTESVQQEKVFAMEGQNAIVDWVYLELRSADAPKNIIATRAALLQRDGDVVDVDGLSPVFFPEIEPKEYHVVLRHRNHLGIMTQESILLDEFPVSIDFSNPDFPTYGNFAQIQLDGIMALWAGDINGDGSFILQGPSNDSFSLFSKVLDDPFNVEGNVNHIAKGYYSEDVDMNGEVSFSGPGSDRGRLFSEVYGVGISLFGADAVPSGLFKENLP